MTQLLRIIIFVILIADITSQNITFTNQQLTNHTDSIRTDNARKQKNKEKIYPEDIVPLSLIVAIILLIPYLFFIYCHRFCQCRNIRVGFRNFADRYNPWHQHLRRSRTQPTVVYHKNEQPTVTINMPK